GKAVGPSQVSAWNKQLATQRRVFAPSRASLNKYSSQGSAWHIFSGRPKPVQLGAVTHVIVLIWRDRRLIITLVYITKKLRFILKNTQKNGDNVLKGISKRTENPYKQRKSEPREKEMQIPKK
ncbi:MAG TPA: hypothetical protein DE314_09990, partial [Sulfitobacter sp.]|nr:hypothetical protein [Sulfitobacter sp.]